MSKRRKKIDAHPDQYTLADFRRKIGLYEETREEILEACQCTPTEKQIENDERPELNSPWPARGRSGRAT